MVYIRPQSIRLITGTSKNGNTILRYRTMAPRKFTVNPISNKKENEKNIQNQIKDFDRIPLVRHIRNSKNRNRRNPVSVAAAIERMCFTSPG